jgi:hypothetical protein
VAGESASWSLTDHLLAAVVDALHVANWQRTSDGAKGRRRPKPIPRPGVGDDATVIGRGSRLSINELDERLGRVREAADGD